MQKYIPTIGFPYIVKFIILFLAYFLTAKLGLSLYALHSFAATIWLPTGIALAFLIIYDYSLWPAVALGAFLVNFLTGATFLVALGIAIGNTLEAVVGAYILLKYVPINRPFESVRDAVLFLGATGMVATVISASVGTLSLLLGHVIAYTDLPETWITWWLGDTLGALVITPFLISWLRPARTWNSDGLKITELTGAFILLIFSNILIFWHLYPQVKDIPLVYFILFPLTWSALRFGARGVTLSILATSIIASASTIAGHGPFVTTPIGEGLFSLQIFIGIISITFLIFLSVVKERKYYVEKLKEHVDELKKALERISSADRAKNDFLAILAHELRNPLAPVLSSLELLKISNTENSETESLIKTMEINVYTMSHLLDDLLDISRISRRKFKLDREPIALQTVLHRAIDIVEPGITLKGHMLTLDLPGKDILVFADPMRIEQVFANLLVNAVRYTKPGGSINVQCTREDNTVLVSIKDNGIGIAPNIIGRIFEPFLQAHKDNMRSEAGIGIGLSLTKKLVELHDGRILAKSDGVDKGSEFIVTLPIPENIQLPLDMRIETKDVAVERRDYQRRHTDKGFVNKKFKVLIVDDNVNAADTMGKLLSRKGHTIESAYDGTTAILTMKTFLPTVVILDIGLPDMDGYEVARKIRAEIEQKMIQKITLIALTGYGQEEDKLKANQAGFDHHLTKPVGLSDIEKILHTL